MKKFIKFMMAFCLGALLVAGSGILTSCDNPHFRNQSEDQWFKEKLDQYLPEAMQNLYAFDDVTDIMLYRQERGTQQFVDSVFLSMTDQEVANVVSVLKKQQGSFKVSDVVYEYNANRRIYSNLPDATTPPSTPTSSPQAEPDPPVATNDSSIKTSSVPLKTDRQ